MALAFYPGLPAASRDSDAYQPDSVDRRLLEWKPCGHTAFQRL